MLTAIYYPGRLDSNPVKACAFWPKWIEMKGEGRRVETLLLAVLCAIGILVSGWVAWENAAGWGIDFNRFGCASSLVG